MTTAETIAIAFSVGSLIFTAGGAYAGFRRLKRDVDGVGRKVNGMQATRERDKEKLLIAMLLTTSDQDREKIARILQG